MVYGLDEVKHLRKKFGLTQFELAQKAGVSQSMIAKVESGLMDPTYTNAQKIFSALDELQKKHEKKALNVMKTKVISASPFDTIKKTIDKMKKYGISQLLVIDDGKMVGMVSEAIILDSLLSSNSHDLKVEDVMKEAPPSVSKDTSIQVIYSLLKHFQIISVTEKGKVKGVITKSDVLGEL